MFDGELLLPGRFNVMNALLAAATCHAMGVSGGAAAASFPFLPPVQGRMERVDGGPGRVRAIVDYAHTPDALQRVLQTLARLKPVGGRLAVVFGCGGDRDASKRPVMGRIAEELADMVILTSDNPRSEDPERILDDIEQGMSGIGHRRIADRGTAISTAVAELGELDILLVAGKGRESYQESMGKRVFFFGSGVSAQLPWGGWPHAFSRWGGCMKGVLSLHDFRRCGELVMNPGEPMPPEVADPVVSIDSRKVEEGGFLLPCWVSGRTAIGLLMMCSGGAPEW